MIGKKIIVRTFSAGVHYGTLASKNGKEVILSNTRRIWYWSGAASLSQMARDGVSNPDSCKFSVVITEIMLTEAIELIPVSEFAEKNIESVPEWKA